MSKTDAASEKQERKKTIRWVVTIFFVTILISGIISLVSDQIMAVSGMLVAFLILLAIVMIGILFDIIGVAVTSADEKPFHSMASRRVKGATIHRDAAIHVGLVVELCTLREYNAVENISILLHTNSLTDGNGVGISCIRAPHKVNNLIRRACSDNGVRDSRVVVGPSCRIWL